MGWDGISFRVISTTRVIVSIAFTCAGSGTRCFFWGGGWNQNAVGVYHVFEGIKKFRKLGMWMRNTIKIGFPCQI